MTTIDKKTAWFALIVAMMCGMVDLAALPIWVGTLISGFGMQEAQAGGLATLFFIGAVLCSTVLAPRFDRLKVRWQASICFAIAAVCFVAMTQTTAFTVYAILHFVAGVAVGAAVSFTHGTMGKSSNPHRLFAFGGLGLSIAAVIYLGVTPGLISQGGPNMLWIVFACIMGFASVVTAVFFPRLDPTAQTLEHERPKFTLQVWMVIFGLLMMSINNSMILSFAERAGDFRGFTAGQVQTALVTMGLIALVPPIIATLLQKRLSAVVVAICGSFIHGAIGFGIMSALVYPQFFGSLIFFPFVMLFTHTFVFGHLASIEPSGRAVAGTTAMVMTGSAVGPLLAGVTVQTIGYTPLGFLAVGFGALAAISFGLSSQMGAKMPAPAE